jgi:3-hydroxyacyl-[acyl-carrier-protein] dehydratase
VTRSISDLTTAGTTSHSPSAAVKAVAGQTLTYQAEIAVLRDEGASVEAKAFADGQPLCEASIFFAHLDHNRSKQLFGDHNFVFGGEMRYLLGRLASQAKAQGQAE